MQVQTFSWLRACCCKTMCVYPPDVQGVDGGSACRQPLLQKKPFVRSGGHDVMRSAAQRSDSAPQSDILQVQQRAAKDFAHKRQADSRPAQAWDRELNEFTVVVRRPSCHRSLGTRKRWLLLGPVLLSLHALHRCMITHTPHSGTPTWWWRAHIAKGCSGAPTQADQAAAAAARVTLTSLKARV